VLDVGNRPFQDNVKQLFSEELLTGDHALTPADRIKKLSMNLLCQWIIIALQHISPEGNVKGFKKCGVSIVVVGADDDMLWNGSEVEVKVRSECEEDEGTDCEEGDSYSDW
jgi:hypothetical protein